MKLKKIALGALAALVVAGTAGWFSLDKETRALLKTAPTNRDLLFWSVPQRDAAFRALDRISLLAKWHVIPASSAPKPLPQGEPLKLPIDLDAYMASQRSAAIVILQDGKLRVERYGLGFDKDGRWTSFSVAKSFTSTLVGAALRDGFIKSMDDKVSDYIPDMKGSAYDDVSVRQLLTMTSGVRWNEDYADPHSDVAQFNNHKPEAGVDALVSYMRKLPREAPAGTRWHYSTGETNLVGILVNQATKKPLADYLYEKVWNPAGMEQQATWLLSKTGNEISGCCIQAATRDFARFGQFVLDGAKAGGRLAGRGHLWPSRHRPARPGLRLPVVDVRHRRFRRARHLWPGHLHRPQAQAGDCLQRQLVRWRQRPRHQRRTRSVLPGSAESGGRRDGRRAGALTRWGACVWAGIVPPPCVFGAEAARHGTPRIALCAPLPPPLPPSSPLLCCWLSSAPPLSLKIAVKMAPSAHPIRASSSQIKSKRTHG